MPSSVALTISSQAIITAARQSKSGNTRFWEPNGNNNQFQQRLQGFQERPGPCKSSIYVKTEKWHRSGPHFEHRHNLRIMRHKPADLENSHSPGFGLGWPRHPRFKTMDANEAVAHVAYRFNEVIAIYPSLPPPRWGNGPTSGLRMVYTRD